jgi:hypothetical protein
MGNPACNDDGSWLCNPFMVIDNIFWYLIV